MTAAAFLLESLDNDLEQIVEGVLQKWDSVLPIELEF